MLKLSALCPERIGGKTVYRWMGETPFVCLSCELLDRLEMNSREIIKIGEYELQKVQDGVYPDSFIFRRIGMMA